jgi:hypothetical protein
MSWRLAGLITLVFVALAAIVLVQYQSNTIVVSITTGVLSSLITGFLLVSIETAADNVKNQQVFRIPAIIDALERKLERLQGIWSRIIQNVNSIDDPNRFWLQERISEKECSKTLYIVGRSHRKVFVEVSNDLRDQVMKTIKSIISKGGIVRIIIPEGADTLESIKQLFRSALTTQEKSCFHLHILPATSPIHYSGLLNDCGVWMMPRMNEIEPEQSCMFCVDRRDAEYVFTLYKTDLELLANKFPAVEL